jgi:hypothetical protein
MTSATALAARRVLGGVATLCLLAGGTMSAQERPMVEVSPIRCWWRTSAGAVRLGEPFDVRLTCAVLETDSVQVVPDETRLSVAGVQLKPFEVIGGSHPADTRAGQRRFFQYRYTLRIIDANQIGQDVALPNLAIVYNVQSRVSRDATLAGRDFTYILPGLPVRVLSQVPDSGVDIRDGSDVGLERLEALYFRARLLDIASVALAAGGALLGVLALVTLTRRRGGSGSRGRSRVSERRALLAAGDELERVARHAAGGWTQELLAEGHAALRVVSAVALGYRISEQPVEAGALAADGRLVVRARVPRRESAAIASAITAADVARAVDRMPPATTLAHRAGVEALARALAAFTAARYVAETGVRDDAALLEGIDGGRAEAVRLARERRWNWLSRLLTGPRATSSPREGAM